MIVTSLWNCAKKVYVTTFGENFMNIWIIYKKHFETHATYSPQIMKETAEKHNMHAEIFFCEYFNILFENGVKKLFYKGEKIKLYPDVAFFRCYDFSLMELLEEKGVCLVNSLSGMKTSRDKYQTKKLVTELGILTPTCLKTSFLDYENITTFFSIPFVMKDNFGASGNNVFLIHNKDEFENVLKVNVEFLVEEFIPAGGKDTRVYIVGNKVVGCVERFSTNGDFRSNRCQGGNFRKTTIPKEIENQSLEIASKINLKICSVDYLFYENKYYLCEVNGNATFYAFYKLGYNMQEEFMNYIQTISHKNYWSRLKFLQRKNDDFFFENKNSRVVFSCPHAVSQFSNGKLKNKDLGSGELGLKIAQENNLSYIIKAKNNGSETKNDNANTFECDYRNALRSMLNENSILFDIHSLKNTRNEELLLAINNMENINYDEKLLNLIKTTFEDFGINVCIDTIYSASENTISTVMHNEFNLKAIEFEFNSNLINPLNKNNKINEISTAFNEIINKINS